MESRIDAPRVAIVQERPGNAGWVEFVERFFPTACFSVEETADPVAGSGLIAPADFLILRGRSSAPGSTPSYGAVGRPARPTPTPPTA